MEIEHLSFIPAVLRTEALDRARRKIGILVSCAKSSLTLKVVGEIGAPFIVNNALQGDSPTFLVFAVVVIACPFRVGGNGGVHPGACGELVIYETTMRGAESGESKAENAVD